MPTPAFDDVISLSSYDKSYESIIKYSYVFMPTKYSVVYIVNDLEFKDYNVSLVGVPLEALILGTPVIFIESEDSTSTIKEAVKDPNRKLSFGHISGVDSTFLKSAIVLVTYYKGDVLVTKSVHSSRISIR